MKRLFLILLSPLVCIGYSATSVTHNGATWSWTEDLTVGYYAKGEPYIVLPSGTMTLTSVTPSWTGAKHGLMINPVVGYWENQGFDSNAGSYSSSLNEALNLPLSVSAGTSLVKAISKTSTPTGNKEYVDRLSVLTVVSSAPASGSFRPPYTGTDKTSSFTTSDLDYTALPNLSTSGIVDDPTQTESEGLLDGDLVEVVTNYQGRETRGDADLDGYGRDMAYKTNEAALWLCLSNSDAVKEQSLINIVQYGIDISASISGGAKWTNDGGHNQGRLVVLAVAAAVLDDSTMLSQLGASADNFAEQGQTFFVTQADVDLAPHDPVNGSTVVDFTVDDIGDPHWGEKHSTQPKRDNANWGAPYRTNTVSCFVGTALVIRLLDLVSECDDSRLGSDGREDPFFEYVEIAWTNEEANRSSSPNTIPLFDASMWDAYRDYSPSSPPPGGSSNSGLRGDGSGRWKATLKNDGSGRLKVNLN